MKVSNNVTNFAKFVIASVIKSSCKYLGRVGSKTPCGKLLGAFSRLFYAKEQRLALEGKPDRNF